VTLRAVRGFKDILPGETERWEFVESLSRGVFDTFGMREIRIPVLERTEVFARGIGECTDIVEKEMYTLIDRSGDSLSLRPEATAGLMRAVIEQKLYAKSPLLRLFTMGPMFRHERPQKGRLRQFHQMNAEVLGTQSPLADAEVIWMAWEVLEELGVTGLRLEINSLGCQVCRPAHREDLKLYLSGASAYLCEDCRRRSATNPLRVFDCKQDACREIMTRAPLVTHYLCPMCSDHLGEVQDFLKAVEVPFFVNSRLVRGLDYYVRTTFEIVSPELGAQSTVAAGGRYDGLVKALGGPDLPGVGMAIGIERLMLLLNAGDAAPVSDLFVAALGTAARKQVMSWIKSLRRKGLVVQMSYEDKGLKAQLKQADRARARYVLIVGEDELQNGKLILRDMSTHEQREIGLEGVVQEIEGLFREE
jgi:histidyl-tRNA synthetase